MAARINKAILVKLYKEGNSIPQVSSITGIPLSTVRRHLKKCGVLRSRSEGIRKAAADGRLGSGLRGKTRVFTQEWKNNIRKSKLRLGEKTAAGITQKPSGYIEITRGANKGRSQHRVIMEAKLGRSLSPDEIVHHKDTARSNNSLDNLEVMSRSDHASHHAKENLKNRKRDSLGRFK